MVPLYATSNQICTTPLRDATPGSLCAPHGSPESPVTCVVEAHMLIELLAHAHDETSRALDVFRSFLMRQRLHTWLVGRDLWRALSVAHMVVDAFST
jgi:hypothetical protein